MNDERKPVILGMNNPINSVMSALYKGDVPAVQKKPAPVTMLLAIFLVLIYLIHSRRPIESLPCRDGVWPTIQRNFIHIELSHLLSNLVGFLFLARWEQQIGSLRFGKAAIFTTVFIVLIETIIKKFFQLNCSIGFSSILFGLFAWHFVHIGADINLVLSLIFILMYPSFHDPKSSIVGHAIGIAGGLMAVAVYNPRFE